MKDVRSFFQNFIKKLFAWNVSEINYQSRMSVRFNFIDYLLLWIYSESDSTYSIGTGCLIKSGMLVTILNIHVMMIMMMMIIIIMSSFASICSNYKCIHHIKSVWPETTVWPCSGHHIATFVVAFTVDTRLTAVRWHKSCIMQITTKYSTRFSIFLRRSPTV